MARSRKWAGKRARRWTDRKERSCARRKPKLKAIPRRRAKGNSFMTPSVSLAQALRDTSPFSVLRTRGGEEQFTPANEKVQRTFSSDECSELERATGKRA